MYSELLEVESGTGTSPLEWEILTGSLPSGLTLDQVTGEISGAPAEEGTYTFSIRITDLCDRVDTHDFSITINP